MSQITKKITVGFVIQNYNNKGECLDQEFVAGDQVDYENEDGDTVDPVDNEQYQSFNMVQPLANQKKDI